MRAERSTLIVTNLTKIAGVVLAILEWARPGQVQDSVLIFCGVLVLGAQVVENMALRTIDRLLGRD